MGSQKKGAMLQAKWAVNFVKNAKWAKNELYMSFWIAGLSPLPTKLLLDLLLPLPIYLLSHAGGFIKKRA